MASHIEDSKYITVHFHIDNIRDHVMDFDDCISFSELLKSFRLATNLLKNEFKIEFENQDITNSYSDEYLYILFPEQSEVHLKVTTNAEDLNSVEEEDTNIKFLIKRTCSLHPSKYQTNYCLTCKKLICSLCISEHPNHPIQDIMDVILPAKTLIGNIFQDKNNYLPNIGKSENYNCISYKSKLAQETFISLKEKLSNFENVCEQSLGYFCEKEDETMKNCKFNIEELERLFIKVFIELKNDIKLKNLSIDQKIFETLYNKLQLIKNFKDKELSKNQLQYEALNELFQPFYQIISEKINELTDLIDSINSLNVFKLFHENIDKNFVPKITLEEIRNEIFNDVNIERKSISRSRSSSLRESTKKANLYDKNLTQKNELTFPLEPINEEKQKNSNKKEESNSKKNKSSKKANLIEAITDTINNNKRYLAIYPITNTTILRCFNDDEDTEDIVFDFNKNLSNYKINYFPEYGSYANSPEYLYYLGGDESCKLAFRVPHDNPKSFELLPEMINSHRNGSAIYHDKKIFIIGGENGSICEYYDFIKNKWIQLNNLNNERNRPILLIFNNYLYAINGYDKSQTIMNCERLNLNNLENGKWEIFSFQDNTNGLFKLYGSGYVKDFTKNVFYLFGGIKKNQQGENEYNHNIFVIDFDKKRIKLYETDMENDVYFINSNLDMIKGQTIVGIAENLDGMVCSFPYTFELDE